MSLSNNIHLTGTISEVGNHNSISLTYSILIGSYSVTSATLPNTSFSQILPLSSSVNGTSSINILSPRTNSTQTWTLSTNDSSGSTASSTASLSLVYPYFYGVSSTATSSASGVNTVIGNITKLITTQRNLVTPLSGLNVCVYFAYPSFYPNLSAILNQSGSNIISNFTQYTINIGSPTGYWEYTSYTVYIYTGTGSNPTTTNVSPFTVYYQFNY
jgi:hypothetical protein